MHQYFQEKPTVSTSEVATYLTDDLVFLILVIVAC